MSPRYPTRMRSIAESDPALLAPLRDLTRADHPDRAGRVVAEGAECVRWLLDSPLEVALVAGKRGVLATLEAELAARGDRTTAIVASQGELSELVGFRFTRGVVAWAHRPQPPRVSDLLARTAVPHLAVLDAVHDPGNVGGLVRAARCLGLDGVVLGPGCADPFYRRSVRVSVGHVFQLPLVPVADLTATLAELSEAGVEIIAAHRGPLSRPLHELRAPAGSWALVLGNEDRGPAPAVVAACHRRVAIAMAPGVDSLNVAMAGGIAMHWLRRASPS